MAVNDYCTYTEIKAAFGSQVTLTSSDDTLLTTLAARASRAIDNDCGRRPGYFYASTDETRYFDGSGSERQRIDDLAAITTLAVAEGGVVDTSAGSGGTYTTWAAADYTLHPQNALADLQPVTEIRVAVYAPNASKSIFYPYPRAVKIAGKWGWATAIPDAIKQAAIIQAARLYKRGGAGFSNVTGVVELAKLLYAGGADAEYERLIAPYRKVSM